MKAEERKEKKGHAGSVLDGVPTAAPALMRAERIGEKASRIGFDWKDINGVRAKVTEELAELDAAIAQKDQAAIEDELGDVLFALSSLARFTKTPPEDALRGALKKFERRFRAMETKVNSAGIAFGEATPEQLDQYWNEAKAATGG